MKKKIFNVGLPRTGTTSFHEYMKLNGYNSCHTNDGFINKCFPEDYFNYLSDKNLQNNTIVDYINKHDVFSDLPWYSSKLRDKIIDNYKDNDNIIFVATIRSKNEWINSIKKIIPCIISQSEKDFHNYEYNEILNCNNIEIDNQLSNYYDTFYKSLNDSVIKLYLEDTDQIKRTLSELLDLEYDKFEYPHLN